MNTNSFKMCIDCANKQSNPQLPKDMYYCPYVQDILPKGIVHYDTDATECVRKNVFREIVHTKEKTNIMTKFKMYKLFTH